MRPTTWHGPTPRLLRILAGLLVFAMFTACSSGGDGDDGAGEGAIDVGDPGDCTVIDMAVSPEKIELITDLARQFNGSEQAREGDDCWFAQPLRKASGGAMQLLAAGWGEDPAIAEAEGPPPVVWSPASSAWGPILNERLEERDADPIALEGTPFMLTPLVIAMPEPMARALGWPDEAIGWGDVLELTRSDEGWAAQGHPEWGPFRLGKTNPNFSTSGLSALIAQSYAATDKTRDLSLEDLADPEVVAFARDIESAVVHYGDTTLTFLNNWYAADQRGTALTYASAAAVEEKSIIDYNTGNPDGVLDPGEEPRPPRVPLVAVYPEEGTLFSDNPFFILDAAWVEESEREGAERFQEFVQQPENQARVLEGGFRPANPTVEIGPPVSPENGVDPEEPQTQLEVPSQEVMASLLDFWNENRKSARVLLVIDVSGSMGDPADPETGETKLDLARRAAIESLDQFKDEDEVGLRIFTTGLTRDGSANFLDLLPIAPIGDQRDELRREIEALQPLNGTPLYTVARASFDEVVQSYDEERINAVVLLTDGRNDDGQPDDDPDELDELLRTLREETEGELGRPVRIFPIAYGTDADLEVLRLIAEATSAAVYDASDPSSITKVFSAVVSNF